MSKVGQKERATQSRIKREPDDPGKFERYQAEALIHQHCPVSGLLGMICYTEAIKLHCDTLLAARNINLPVHARTEWYFR